MLRTAMGPAIAGWLEEPAVAEVMLNPNGCLWIDRLAGGLEDTGKRLSAADASASSVSSPTTSASRCTPAHRAALSAELRETGERFEGLIPPIDPGAV